jgi:nucleotide-binding universal stress UspA family protein
MIERIVVAVDDTRDSLAAAGVAIELAAALHAELRAVHVAVDHGLPEAVQAASDRADVDARLVEAGAAVLARVTALATAHGVPVRVEVLAGEVAPAILGYARTWPADLVVLGKSARSASGEPYIGSRSRHVLEFAAQPVLVVPPDGLWNPL